ncbi:MAG: helix-turn-helix domain-containing protein [Christensenellaceae bacterium]|jgi:excisionase family DNA binding protein|nr:helix-turn-helix domain-containing protein [Christensenellaceae bacterium]
MSIIKHEIFNEYPDVLDMQQFAAMLKIGKNYAYKLVNKGLIYSKKIGKKYLIAKTDVIEYFFMGVKK